MSLIEILEILLSRSRGGEIRTVIHRWQLVKTLALVSILVPFSVLGACAQYEAGNLPLMVMYIALGPIVAAGAWAVWRHVLFHQRRNGGDSPISVEEPPLENDPYSQIDL